MLVSKYRTRTSRDVPEKRLVMITAMKGNIYKYVYVGTKTRKIHLCVFELQIHVIEAKIPIHPKSPIFCISDLSNN